MRLYKPGATPRGTLEQTQRWLNTELQRVEQSIDSIRAEFIKGIGYGEMSMFAAQGGTNLTTNWQTFTHFDTIDIEPVGMALDIVNSQFDLVKLGLWTVRVEIILTHNISSSAERIIDVRMYNVTQGQQVGDIIPVTVARSSAQTDIKVATLQLNRNTLVEPLAVQLRAPTTVSSVLYTHANLSGIMESPYISASDVTRTNRQQGAS